MDKVIRKESSIPVQGRISVIDLANMDRYWMVKEGIQIKSMSQLLSWTFSAMCDVIEANSKMPDGFNSVSDANKYLTNRGLYQQGMKKKGQSRIIAAMGFENLRRQGLDPAAANNSQTAYNTVHSKSSGGIYDAEPNVGQDKELSKEEVNEMIRVQKERKAKDQKYREKELNDAKNSNMVTVEGEEITLKEGMSDEELIEYSKKRDEERIKLENAPINVEDFELAKK